MVAFDQRRAAASRPYPDRTPAARESARGPSGRGSEYAELSRRIRQSGLLERRHAYYVSKIALNVLLLAAGWIALFRFGDSWWQMVTAACLAIVSAQIAFVAHDAGHRQIFRRRRPNDLTGTLLANLLLGISYGWWVGKHNRHHRYPNHADLDPDMNIGAVAFTSDQARSRRGLARVLARFQAFMFFPLLLGEAVHLHAASVRALLRSRGRPWRLEASLLLGHFALYASGLLLVLSPVRALVFLIVNQGLLGLYLGCAFAPNHKGMPVLTEEQQVDFLRRQVLTSRNVRGSRLIDFALGGLNYQIEHHLFPSLPRPSLRRARPHVRAFLLEHGLPYHESSLLGSYSEAIRHLHTVGAPLRPVTAD
jgi:fatty acid desaturase